MLSSIILAAGMSKRMKDRNKLLLQYGELTILEKTINNLSRSNINEIIIVLGHDSNNIKRALKQIKFKKVFNEYYSDGIASSIISGLKAINNSAKGVMICLGDMPQIKTSSYNLLIEKFYTSFNEKKIILPTYNKKKGNPIILSSFYFNFLYKLKGDKGARDIIEKYASNIIRTEIDDEGLLKDIDNDLDYELLLKNNAQ